MVRESGASKISSLLEIKRLHMKIKAATHISAFGNMGYSCSIYYHYKGHESCSVHVKL